MLAVQTMRILLLFCSLQLIMEAEAEAESIKVVSEAASDSHICLSNIRTLFDCDLFCWTCHHVPICPLI